MISDKLMILNILLKQEWKKNRRSLRFRLSWLLMLCVFICGTIAFVHQWHNTETEYEEYRKENDDEYHGWTVTAYAIITQEYLLQPRLSSLIDPCSEQQLHSIFTYNAFGIHNFSTAFSVKNPLMLSPRYSLSSLYYFLSMRFRERKRLIPWDFCSPIPFHDFCYCYQNIYV